MTADRLRDAAARLREVAEAATVERHRIPSCPGYSVTAMGDVWSEDSNWRGYGPRRMTPNIHDGYLRVDLKVNGREVHRFPHRLVAEVFSGPPPRGMQVCHRDGNRLNNWWPNLRYGTAADNAADRARHGTVAQGEANGFAKFSDAEIQTARDLYAEGATKAAIARELGMSKRHVSNVIDGNLRTGVASPIPPLSQREADATYIATMSPPVALAMADHLDDILTRHAEGAPVELMLHYDADEECEKCELGEGHLTPVCDGCYPSYDGMDGHAVWPCREFRSTLTLADAILGPPTKEQS